ncbi:hypothetical protein [Plantactinospora sp. BB1]|uniref:hypothetical protein n=1 Tax=Plantactinospora sp. BB1 TaxID=2071627 RepID=UPI00131F2E42|nr:hypothetical protein [Plantactinospora sp. BB1]
MLALLAVPAFALRAWLVASFDLGVASALMLHTTPAQLIYAALLLTLPIFLILFGVLLARLACRATIQREQHATLVVLAPYVGLPFFMVPIAMGFPSGDWAIAAMMLIAFPHLVTTDITAERLAPDFPKPVGKRFVQIGMFSIALFALMPFVYPGMWLPPERATVSGTPKKIYVLERKDGEYVFFDPAKKSVIRLPEAEIKDRQYCDESDMEYLAEVVIAGPQGRPACP